MATPVMSSADQAGMHQRHGYTEKAGVYPPQQGYAQQGYAPNTYVSYEGQALGPHEYVDKRGRVVRRSTRGARFAAILALCWCCTWPCHGPCCGGL